MNQHYLYYTLFDFCQIIHKKYSIGLVFILLLITTIFGFNSTLRAQTLPQEITYQGKLLQDGVPFLGSTTMIFELINPTTNVIEWTETQTINVQDGLYSVVLGVQTPFTPNFFAQNPSLGLRVSVNGSALTPITVLRAVPYAHSAGSVGNNSINSIQIVNGTIQTIDIASGGQNKVLVTDANGLVTWIDRSAIALETDPEVSTSSINTIPRWNGTTLINGSILDDGTSLFTSAPFTFSNPTPIIYTNNGFTNTLIFEPLGDDKIITFPDANGTVLLDGNLAGNFGNGLDILFTDASKVGLGGQLVENVLISGFDGLVNHNFELVNMESIEFQANDFINIDAGNTIELSATDIEFEADEVLITLDVDAAFVIEDTEPTPHEILVLDRDADGINEFSIDLGTVFNFGALTQGGEINMKAQDFDDFINSFEGANFTLEGGSGGGSNRGGNVILNGGGGSANKGKIFLQDDGGNVEVGSGTDSELKINGWLHLPSLDPIPTSAILDFPNFLYADNNGELFWGNQNLSLGSSLWEETNLNNIFSQGSTKVGIGAFTTTLEPLADLHIRRVLTSAELKITTLRNGAGQNSKLILQSATNNSGNADNSTTSDILGEILFEGYKGSNFQENAKIAVIVTDVSPILPALMKTDMRFSINGSEKLTINNNFDVNLGTTAFGTGGGFYVSGQHSTDNVSASTGGYLNMFAGNNLESNGVGGNVNLNAGMGGDNGAGGLLSIAAGAAGANGTGGQLDIRAGNAGISGIGGNINIDAGAAGTHGTVNLQALGGNVNIGATGGAAKLNVQTNIGNVLSLTGLDVSNTSNTLEVSSVEEAKAAFFSRSGNTGTTNPVVLINENNANASASTLRINGGATSATGISVNSTSTFGLQRIVEFKNNNTDRFFVENNGNTTINGDLLVTGGFFNPSDFSYKKQINTLKNSLSNILSIRGTNYYWKDQELRGEKLQFGVIAQEIEKVFPNLVNTNEEGYKSVNYIGLVPVLIEATKEQQTIIDNQEEEIKTQKKELENLKKQISELKEIVASLQTDSNSALAQKVDALEKQLIALVESLSNKTETTTETASLKEE